MIRIGIVGIDTFAHLHAGVLLTNNNYEIAGCYSPDNRESMLFARKYRLVSYSSLEALFTYADAIDIAGNFPEMMILAEKSLKRMKHVYIAQPNQLSLTEIQHLVKLSNESGAILQLGAGYRFCPAYEQLAELKQKPRIVDIKHQLARNGEEAYTQLNTELAYDLDLVLGVLHAEISKIDIKTWTKTEGQPDLLNCRLECDNGCSINIVLHTVTEGEPKLELIFNLPDMVVNVNVFRSIIEKQYCEFDVVDSNVLEAYNEKNIHKQNLTNFYKAICGDQVAIIRIEEQLQSIAASNLIVERIRKMQSVVDYH